jgi:flagellar hook-basal body complex protein FliE
MTMRVTNVSSDLGLSNSMELTSPKKAPDRSFASDLKAMTEEVNGLQNEADQSMQKAAVAGADNIHETMLKVEEADLSMRLMLKLRGKALDAYDQIMRMGF